MVSVTLLTIGATTMGAAMGAGSKFTAAISVATGAGSMVVGAAVVNADTAGASDVTLGATVGIAVGAAISVTVATGTIVSATGKAAPATLMGDAGATDAVIGF